MRGRVFQVEIGAQETTRTQRIAIEVLKECQRRRDNAKRHYCSDEGEQPERIGDERDQHEQDNRSLIEAQRRTINESGRRRNWLSSYRQLPYASFQVLELILNKMVYFITIKKLLMPTVAQSVGIRLNPPSSVSQSKFRVK